MISRELKYLVISVRCKGICLLYKASSSSGKFRYLKGQKRCGDYLIQTYGKEALLLHNKAWMIKETSAMMLP